MTLADRPAYQRAIAKFIFDCEARHDERGHLAIYKLPAGDGGGRFEIAGINDRYDHDEAEQLKRLASEADTDAEQAAIVTHMANVAAEFTRHFFLPSASSFLENTTALANRLRDLWIDRQYDQVEQEAQEYYLENTDVVAAQWLWISELARPAARAAGEAIEAYLRDTAFNRGIRGAAKILQRALGVTADGSIGPITRAALAKAAVHDPAGLLLALRAQTEAYERAIAPPVGVRAKFWKGLVNRWDKRLDFARSFLS